MLPLVLEPSRITIGLAGKGEALTRRRAHLAEAGVTAPVPVAEDAGSALDGLDVLYVAGLPRSTAARLAAAARRCGVLVNVEDEPALCDFHVPATVRRGDLLLTVSSAGRSPGLVRLIREWLSARFGAEWNDHVREAGQRRAVWRSQGLPTAEVARRTRALGAGWLS